MTGRTRNNILLVLAVFLVVLDFGDDVFTVDGPQQFSYSVSYDSITALELVNLEDPGEAISGGENSSYRWGTWSSSTWENYTLCVSKGADTAICVTIAGGERLVFNYQGDKTTAQIYEMFTQLLTARRAS